MIEFKDSPESSTGSFKMYTGVIPYRVVAVNPTMEELKEIAPWMATREPEYVKTFENNGVSTKVSVVTFWLKSVPVPLKHITQHADENSFDVSTINTEKDLGIVIPLTFNISHDPIVSANGKVRYINTWGKVSSYVPEGSAVKSDYFSDIGIRKAHKGEEELCSFLVAFLDFRAEINACQPDITALIKGDFSELKEVVEFGNSRAKVVACMTGISSYTTASGDSKYKNVLFTKMFWKSILSGSFKEKAEQYYNKYVAKNPEYNSFKADISNFNICEYDLSLLESKFQNGVEESGDTEEDLPF